MGKGGVVRQRKVVHLNRIRVESEFIRFPIHNLAARDGKTPTINIHGIDKSGREIHWEVSPNSKYGHPGELAYKLDTLIINKRIDEKRCYGEVPKILKLGSISDIAKEIRAQYSGRSAREIKKALLQNASTFITATFSYTTSEGSDQTLEIADTRYGVVFTGEKLPDGRKADQVYVVMHDLYLNLLNSSRTRPLDYEYLKNLPPSSQRLYELISPIIFAAIKHNLPHAKYLYSSFSTFSALTRYSDQQKMAKQMYKIIKPHKDSDYIASVNYKETIDSMGRIDWEMQIVPGEKARKEHAAFTGTEYVPKPEQKVLPLLEPQSEPTEVQRCAESLRSLGVSGMTAQCLAQDFLERAKLWVHIAMSGCVSKKVKEPGAYLVKAIENDYAPPKAYRDLLKAKASPNEQRKTLTQSKESIRGKNIDPESQEYREMCERFRVKPRR